MTPDHSALIERLEAGFLSSNPHHSEVYQTNTLLALAAAALRDLTEWRDIATAPKDGTVIDVWTKMGRVTGCKYGMETKNGFGDAVGGPGWVSYAFDVSATEYWCLLGDAPTHWLPLPSAPNQAKEAD